MKFKAGDKVRIREWDDMAEEYGVTSGGEVKPPEGERILPDMRKCCGKETTVVLHDEEEHYMLEIDGKEWYWPECALLPVEEPKTIPPKKKPVAYIAGSITGLEDYKKAFAEAKDTLDKNGYSAINPAALNDILHAEDSYEDYMDICLMLVEKADFLVLLPGWEKSPGANREMGYAKGLDKIVLTLEEICKTTNTSDTRS